MKNSTKFVIAVSTLIAALAIFAYTGSRRVIEAEKPEQRNEVGGARGAAVSSNLEITDIVSEYLDTHLKVEHPYPQEQGLELVIGDLSNTHRGISTHPLGAKWRIEIGWRYPTGGEDHLVVYALQDLKVVEIDGPPEQIKVLQVWVESTFGNDEDNN